MDMESEDFVSPATLQELRQRWLVRARALHPEVGFAVCDAWDSFGLRAAWDEVHSTAATRIYARDPRGAWMVVENQFYSSQCAIRQSQSMETGSLVNPWQVHHLHLSATSNVREAI